MTIKSTSHMTVCDSPDAGGEIIRSVSYTSPDAGGEIIRSVVCDSPDAGGEIIR